MLIVFFSWSYWKDLVGVGGCKEKGLLFKWNPIPSLKSMRAILIAFSIAKKRNNALRELLSTKQLIIVNRAWLDC